MTDGRHRADAATAPDVDVVVVGAGFAGLYMLHRLRGLGFSARAFEAADDVGGTWYWNRYPGARVDIPSIDYMYSFDPEWSKEWRWSEKYATQPEILRYLNYVADKHDLRRDVQFSTRVEQAMWHDDMLLWHIRTDRDEVVTCRFCVMATGCLSSPKPAEIEGYERFAGDIYFTSRWPHDDVDFTGQRVAVIGTGSSGIQSIPVIATEAAQLTVFQRTANYSVPAHNGPISPEQLDLLTEDEAEYRQAARRSGGGIPRERSMTMTFSVSEAERQARYERAWEIGELFEFVGVYADVLANQAANDEVAEFVRNKIRSIVKDPETAEALCPTGYPFGCKRLCLDTNYYATYNLPNVRLVDLRKQPIVCITHSGIDTADESFQFDSIVFATGFDAVTGAITAIDIAGRGGVSLRDKWTSGPSTYLGLMTVDFPNLFMITGPGSPSVLSNMAVSIEQHVEWVADCLAELRARGREAIEPTEVAEAGWMRHVNDCGAITLFSLADSWYMGANVPGKARALLPYVAGVDVYRAACEEVVVRDYLGFRLFGAEGTHCNDGVVRQLQPDVQMMLDQTALLNLPPLESMSVDEARVFVMSLSAGRPPGPDVGEVIDATLPGAGGDLAFRLYRPPTTGPHPILAYFHGGGWVLGNATSDDPLCRDLCVRANAIVVSVDYRRAPEHHFPAAVDDGLAAVQWIADRTLSLGGQAGKLAVSGWGAGGGIAAVVCWLARNAGGPDIVGQALLTPITDCDLTRRSYIDNADGYGLTAALMGWFLDHYADGADRRDPRVSPLRAADLSGLPPAIVVTGEFDPLRDEGEAYVAALDAAGVPVVHLPAHGHTHTSLTMVDLIISGAPVRARLADALQQFFVSTTSNARLK
jgi:cation diffusion facilitator CzcD-associated flavoprotein CzcO/acetyl esterase/lipase